MSSQPLVARYSFADAEKCYAARDLKTAEHILLTILKDKPDSCEILLKLAVIYYETDQMNAALRALLKAKIYHPREAGVYNALGVVFKKMGDLKQAIKHYQHALDLDSELLDVWTNLGNLYSSSEQKHTAYLCYEKALAISDKKVTQYLNVIDVLIKLKKFNDVIVLSKRCLKKFPKMFDVLVFLGVAYRETKQFDLAIDSYKKAVAINPKNPSVYNNLGNIYLDKRQFKQAYSYYAKALEINPNFANAVLNIAHTCREEGKISSAISNYQKILNLQPDNANAHFNLGLCYLKIGKYIEGWAEYEWRWLQPDLAIWRHNIPLPQWQGESLVGKRILIHSEQGFGDTLQFVRFLPLVKGDGGYVIGECRIALLNLFKTIENVDEWVMKGNQFPPFDYHISLASLPHVLKIKLDQLPGKIPYLQAPAEAMLKWQQKLKIHTGFKIGIVWSGSTTNPNRFRSCKLEYFAPLFSINKTTYFGLQVDANPAEYSKYPKLVNLAKDINDFADTAAAIIQFDLVITIDTSVAHLAGALGKPTWVVLSNRNDWRWMLQREDSPWYPTMRLFRQTKMDDWKGVFKRINHELKALVAGDTSKLIPTKWLGDPVMDL